MALPPCHMFAQFYVADGALSCQMYRSMNPARTPFQQPHAPSEGTHRTRPAPHHECMRRYQRSADLGLGVPFNIASYALLTCLFAHLTGLKRGEFVHSIGDAHVYLNHLDQVEEQLGRDPRPLPTMRLDPTVDDLFGFRYEHFELNDYDPHPHIAAPVAV